MRATTFTALMMATLLFEVGCIPVNPEISPAWSGVVIDAHTHAPILGAEAVIAYSGYPPPTIPEEITNTRPPTVFTKADGSFMIPAAHWHFWTLPLPIDPQYPISTLVVNADGYVPAIIPVTYFGEGVTNVSKILLLPKK